MPISETPRNLFQPAADDQKRLISYLPSDGPARAYVYSQEIVVAVNVALATNRALLISGPPGGGKSTLARHVAQVMGWRYLQRTIGSRTTADDLLAGFDSIRRLNDAQMRGTAILPDAAYVTPGTLWWAFDPGSAIWRGQVDKRSELEKEGRFPLAVDPSAGQGPNVVVLLDEIDKADPDLPNDLLEPLDARSFTSAYSKTVVEAKGKALVIITTNGERELPPAFLRRCIALGIEPPDKKRLIEIGRAHFDQQPEDFLTALAAELIDSQARARDLGLREPSTAEYLDTIRACIDLGEKPGGQRWRDIALASMWKSRELAPAADLQEGASAG